jgi:hypothetical protein
MLSTSHAVNKIIGNVDTLESFNNAVFVTQITAHHLGSGADPSLQVKGVTSQAADSLSSRLQGNKHPAADVSGGSGEQYQTLTCFPWFKAHNTLPSWRSWLQITDARRSLMTPILPLGLNFIIIY